MSASPEPSPARKFLRERLLAQRAAHAASPQAAAAGAALTRELVAVLRQIEPEVLGVYWPVRSEFNAVDALRTDESAAKSTLALPFTTRTPPRMTYRRWDGTPPTARDESGIPAPEGDQVVPDTVLVPCVGYTAQGYRLGYGGGFFDRWMALHPHVTAIGIAWSHALLGPAEFTPDPHDQPLTLVVTEAGVVG